MPVENLTSTAADAAAVRGRTRQQPSYAPQQAPPGSSSLWAQRYSVEEKPVGRGSFATVSSLLWCVCVCVCVLVFDRGRTGGSLVSV